MGRKVHPVAFRLGQQFDWESQWFAGNKRRYRDLVVEDEKIRRALRKKLENAGLAKTEIARLLGKIEIILHVSRPGVAIGRGGVALEAVKKEVRKILKRDDGKDLPKMEIRVEPVKQPDLEARLVAKNIAEQLQKRMPYKRVINKMAERVMEAGARGVKIRLTGRIAGAEIARNEWIKKGRVPLSTLREEIDFATVPALTKKGYVGVRVWINRA